MGFNRGGGSGGRWWEQWEWWEGWELWERSERSEQWEQWEIAPEPPKGDKLEKDGGRWWELWERWERWEQWERCRDLWVVGVLRETRSSWKGVRKIEIKNFAKGVAGEAIKTFGKV